MNLNVRTKGTTMAKVDLDQDDVLVCPVCGYNFIHQGSVCVMNRFKEDGDGTKTTVSLDGKTVNVTHLPDSELPGRRDTVRINFWCEGCPRSSVLEIAQHKGQTFFSWVEADNK